MARKPNIRLLTNDQDIHGLIEALRYPEDPEIRSRAAQALGKIGNVKTVESLIRSHLQDPDSNVQQASLDALHQIIGGETELAVKAYTIPDETWIEEKTVTPEELLLAQEGPDGLASEDDLEEDQEDSGEGDEGDEGEMAAEGEEPGMEQDEDSDWNESDIQALTAIIRVDHNLKKRIMAIKALSRIPNTRAIDALASIALWSEEKRLREAAYEALVRVYGDNLDEVLQSYRQASQESGFSDSGDEGGEEEDEEEDEEGEDFEEEDDEDFEAEDLDDEDEDDQDLDVEEEDYVEGAGEDELNNDANLNVENPPASQPFRPKTQLHPYSPVIHEEKPGWITYLLFGLLLVIILIAVVYLLGHS